MNKELFKNPVFLLALALCAFIAVWAIAFNESFTAASNGLFGFGGFPLAFAALG